MKGSSDVTRSTDGRRTQIAAESERTGTWGKVNRNRLRIALQHAQGRVVDIGCGSDAYTSRLSEAGFETLGADLLLPVGRKPEIFAIAAVSELPFQNRSLGTALLFEVLEHVSDPCAAIEEIGRVADRLILSVPNCAHQAILPMSGLAQYHYTDPTHVNFFDETSITDLLEQGHWNILKVEHINPVSPGILSLYGWGLPLSLARWLAPVLKRLPRPRKITMSIVVVADWVGERG